MMAAIETAGERSSMTPVLQYLDSVETGFCLRLNRLSRRASIGAFFRVVSRLGDGGFWLATGVAIVLVRGGESLPDILQIGATAGIAALIYRVLKERLARERPYIANLEIHCGAAPLDRYSFPSGHTMHAVCIATCIARLAPEFMLVSVLFAVLVASSRVVLGLHYPSDVAAGALLGYTLACLGLAIF
jgi:undecaprenyl-diphosphatase